MCLFSPFLSVHPIVAILQAPSQRTFLLAFLTTWHAPSTPSPLAGYLLFGHKSSSGITALELSVSPERGHGAKLRNAKLAIPSHHLHSRLVRKGGGNEVWWERLRLFPCPTMVTGAEALPLTVPMGITQSATITLTFSLCMTKLRSSRE